MYIPNLLIRARLPVSVQVRTYIRICTYLHTDTYIHTSLNRDYSSTNYSPIHMDSASTDTYIAEQATILLPIIHQYTWTSLLYIHANIAKQGTILLPIIRQYPYTGTSLLCSSCLDPRSRTD